MTAGVTSAQATIERLNAPASTPFPASSAGESASASRCRRRRARASRRAATRSEADVSEDVVKDRTRSDRVERGDDWDGESEASIRVRASESRGKRESSGDS